MSIKLFKGTEMIMYILKAAYKNLEMSLKGLIVA
jgi:hypothetical protein